jgi:hypothetical protein
MTRAAGCKAVSFTRLVRCAFERQNDKVPTPKTLFGPRCRFFGHDPYRLKCLTGRIDLSFQRICFLFALSVQIVQLPLIFGYSLLGSPDIARLLHRASGSTNSGRSPADRRRAHRFVPHEAPNSVAPTETAVCILACEACAAACYDVFVRPERVPIAPARVRDCVKNGDGWKSC